MGAFQLEFNLCVLVVPDRLRNLDPRKSTWIWGWSGGGRAGEAGDPDPIRQHSEPSSLMAPTLFRSHRGVFGVTADI